MVGLTAGKMVFFTFWITATYFVSNIIQSAIAIFGFCLGITVSIYVFIKLYQYLINDALNKINAADR